MSPDSTQLRESLRPAPAAVRRARARLPLTRELALAALPTATVLGMLALVEALTAQRLLFASLASSAFLIYLDPEHGTNRVQALVLSQALAAGFGWALYAAAGPGYVAAGTALVATILAMVLLDVVHPPAVATAMSFALRAGDASNLALFALALGVVAVLVLLQRAAVWGLLRLRRDGGSPPVAERALAVPHAPERPGDTPPRSTGTPMTRSIRWVWLGPVAFLVHDAEEVLAFAPWVRRHAGALPAAVRPLVEGVDTRQFAAAVLALLAGYVVASVLGVRALRAGRRPWPYLVVTGAFVGNGLTHLLQAAAFGGYTPGVVTAAVVSVPYGWAAGRTLLADGIAPRRLLLALVGVGVALQVPLAWLALQAGRRLGAP